MSANPRLWAPPTESPSDGEIVGRVLGGDREAFRLLVERYQESLFRYALGMVGSPDAAADMVQDSMIKSYRSLARCQNPDQFGAWLHRIVRNRCLDYLKNRRRAVIPLHDVEEIASAGGAVDEPLERDEIRGAVFAALARLPDDQREAFLLKHVHEKSYEEMAELAGASVSALKMRVKRAREALQLLLQGKAL